ncbi:DUF1289 domain-containing protein [Sediminicurvatus halobius]|uniref:DUF1289 domain-containing protein n=1 Tax=Sediminicurvatus halobius TaxID=2182432 RepID=A0A2U2MWL5_9GAMM|nr:DUF1289 domain-containing protein [Spiribacter halobius]PWG61250.1 DUF1289 domain-containing protein [Spiribacter halobius]UEX78440.1 DUF1289 domain-containing protein [Spiribacter halobius]
MDIASPCIGVCRVDNGRCRGCGRTLSEIAQWTRYSDAERAAIMRRLARQAAR